MPQKVFCQSLKGLGGFRGYFACILLGISTKFLVDSYYEPLLLFMICNYSKCNILILKLQGSNFPQIYSYSMSMIQHNPQHTYYQLIEFPTNLDTFLSTPQTVISSKIYSSLYKPISNIQWMPEHSMTNISHTSENNLNKTYPSTSALVFLEFVSLLMELSTGK